MSEGKEAKRILAVAVKPYAQHWGGAVVMSTLALHRTPMRTPLAHAAGYCLRRLRAMVAHQNHLVTTVGTLVTILAAYG